VTAMSAIAVLPKVDVDRWLGDVAKAYEEVKAGGAPPVWLPRWVAESWHQSRQRGVNPNGGGSVVLGEVEVTRRLREFRLAPAWNTLWEGLEGVASGERMVEVTDGDGYVLLRKGDNSSKVCRLANGFGFVVGARMDMSAMGTTGIAVALEHRGAVQVPGPCHWRQNQHAVNCTAVPVPDPRRKDQPLAVINVTGLGPIAHPDTLRLVRVVAGNVQRELVSVHCKKTGRLREDAGSLDRIAGWALVADRDGWVVAWHRF
jgi:transcriptional regulator of acetoin/glycerol metabolism